MANAYQVIGYTYAAALHCLACAKKAHDLDPEAEDDRNSDIYCAGLKRDKTQVPFEDAPHAVFDYENDAFQHGANCDTCDAEVFESWCDGCAECAPDLTICAETRDDDPWTCTLTVAADSPDAMSRWLAHNGNTIDGDSWEQDGNLAYASPACYVGCVAAWTKEGYANVDQSQFCDDPLDHFGGMSSEEIDAELARVFSGDDEERADIRADIATHFAVTAEEWRRDDPDAKQSFSAYRAERVRRASLRRGEDQRLAAWAEALQVKLPL